MVRYLVLVGWVCWLVGVILPATTFAQSFSISGVVEDQSGALIPNATVTLRSAAGIRTAVANGRGSFSFDKTGPGAYDLQVEQEGFKTATAHVVVSNRTPRPVEIKLQIANLQQQVTVAGDDVQVS